MTKVVGRVTHTDLEGGAWTLITEQGVVYQLRGGGSELLIEGVRAEVEGRIATKAMGLAMVGDILQVKRYRVLE